MKQAPNRSGNSSGKVYIPRYDLFGTVLGAGHWGTVILLPSGREVVLKSNEFEYCED